MDKIIVIVGPTGIGKTSLSVQLAKRLNGAVISGDSMQVYKKMDIGTAKVTEEEKQGIPHYLVDIQNYDEPYNVKIFQEKCRQAEREIVAQGKVPILCGGTGLYIKAALYDYTFEEEEIDEAYQKELEALDEKTLYDRLVKVDPRSAEKIHPHNRKRILRALQIAHTGMSKSEREQHQQHRMLFDAFLLGLDVDREVLYDRIDRRVEAMFDQGLVQEATALFSEPATWKYNSFQAIGYKEFQPYFEGTADLDEVKEAIKVHSRQYAKRQYTWFRHQMDVRWYETGDPQIEKDIKAWLYEREG
ncbi:tRNA (adenosine(37)-N6)-dimethylallyltransferase MiaA [Catenisphaera adipataccumulans]|uniref:tRNA dimethylallyltransferase n=1 Tax=Catenisphaera adipataccumulans TaxID=700500 RepID=A0A7W8D1G9_9FIRM|nr:tRNA dimethylallyltransferase [Catenisphaera adipataccumulans]